LKQNDEKQAALFVPSLVFQQIKYLGILDTIRVRREGYSVRINYNDFYNSFAEVCQHKIISDSDLIQKVKMILEELSEYNISNCLFGHTKLFIKQDFYHKLERLKNEILAKRRFYTTKIQSHIRRVISRKKYFKMKKSAAYLQYYFRSNKSYIKFQKLKIKTMKIQATFRAYIMNRFYKYMLVCIYKLQASIRSFLRKAHVRLMISKGELLVRFFKRCLIKLKISKVSNMRKYVYKLIDNSWRYIVKKYQHYYAIVIQACARGFLAKKKHWKILIRGRMKREIFLKEKKTIIIQKNYRAYMLLLSYRKHLEFFIIEN
jgi:myosin heavy subunit